MPGPRRVVVECLVMALVAGVLAGVAWYLLVPEVSVSVGDDGEPRLGTAAASGVFSYDAWFMVVGSATGLLLGGALFARHRGHPVVTVVAVAATGVLGSVVAWRVGVVLGPETVEARAVGLEEGGTLPLDLGIEAYGVLLAWPIAALVGVLGVSAWLDDREPVTLGTAPSPDAHPPAEMLSRGLDPPSRGLDRAPGEPTRSDVGPGQTP